MEQVARVEESVLHQSKEVSGGEARFFLLLSVVCWARLRDEGEVGDTQD